MKLTKTFKCLLPICVLVLTFLVIAPLAQASGYSVTNLTTGTSLSGLNWKAIASSGSGKYVTAVADGDDIWTSSDYGAHWTNTTQGTGAAGLSFQQVTVSYSGQYQAAITGITDIWTSSDYGAHWTNRTAGTATSGLNWQFIISSYTGKYMVATAYTDGVFISSDYGATWKKASSGTPLNGEGLISATVSYDGKYLTVVDGGKDIYGSSDYGASWHNLTADLPVGTDLKQFYSSTASVDGKTIYIDAENADAWVSHDYGVTWSNLTNRTGISGLDVDDNATGIDISGLQASPDGHFVMAKGNTGGHIYASRDYGVTWTDLTSSSPLSGVFWSSAYLTASGERVYGQVGGGNLYLFSDSSLHPSAPVITHPNITTNVSANNSVTVNVFDGVSGYDPYSLSVVSGPSHGTAVDPPGDLTYTPNKGYSGSDYLVYQICSWDDTVCSQATLTFNVLKAPNTGAGKPQNNLTVEAVAIGSIIALVSGLLVIHPKKS